MESIIKEMKEDVKAMKENAEKMLENNEKMGEILKGMVQINGENGLALPIVIRKELNELRSRELELQLKQLEEEKKLLDKELLEWMAEQGTPMVRTENFTISLIEKHYVKAKCDDVVGFLEENFPDYVNHTSKAKETEIKSILKEEPEHPLSAVYELVPLHQIQCRKR